LFEVCRNDANSAKELLAEARSVAVINIAIKGVFIFTLLSLGWEVRPFAREPRNRHAFVDGRSVYSYRLVPPVYGTRELPSFTQIIY
jgi:hypothetical protein